MRVERAELPAGPLAQPPPVTLFGLFLALAVAGALGMRVVGGSGPGFDLELIGLSIVGALLAGVVLSIDHRRLQEPEPPPAEAGRQGAAGRRTAARRTAPADGGDRASWALADEPGITPELRDDLLVHFGSRQALCAASVEDLEEAPRRRYTLARRIRAALDS